MTSTQLKKTISLSGSFLLLSGTASLIYQVTWVRLLMTSIGSTSVSVSIVLGTFFLGLSLGSYLITKLPGKHINSFQLYLWLEAIIGICAIVLLPILLNLDQLIAALPAIAQNLTLKIILVMLLLLIPCLCIGATYPLMANIIVQEQDSIGSRLGWLYSMNTVGAVFGALSVGFILIPAWGLDGSIYLACLLNLLIVISGWYYKSLFAPYSVTTSTTHGKTEPSIANNENDSQKTLYTILFCTGFVALASEVAWTKYLSILTHTTIYGFSAILAIFLTGIALGAWKMKHIVDTLKQPLIWLTSLVCLLALSLTLTRAGLELLPSLYESLTQAGDMSAWDHPNKYILISVILIIPTFLFGAIFTLTIRMLCHRVEETHHHAGKAYAINTLGGILGATLVGLWLIPSFGTNAVLVMTSVLIALLPLLLLRKVKFLPAGVFIILAVLVNAICVAALPQLDYRNIITVSQYFFDPDKKLDRQPKYTFLKEGRTGVISVSTYNESTYRLQTNSLAESVVTPPDPFPWRAETLLGLFPYLLHEDPENVLLIGLGAGTTVSAATLSTLDSIKVVEIEPAIADAANHIFKDGIKALQDSRVTLVFDDARQQLLIDQQNYDAIVSQPSHPWLAGSANLFTKEYFEIAQSKLNNNGIMVQWLNLFNMDSETLASIFRAFYGTFPHGMNFVIRNEYSMILIGSGQPIIFDFETMTRRLNESGIKPVINKWRIQHAFDLLRFYGLNREQSLHAAGDTAPNSDTNLLTEVRLAKINYFSKGKNSPFTLIDNFFSFDITAHLDPKKRKQQLVEMARYFQMKRYKKLYKLTTELNS